MVLNRRGVFSFICRTLSGFSVIIALCLPVNLYGESILQVYQLAIDKDPQFKGAQFERLALKEGLRQAEARIFPVIAFEGSEGRTYQNIVSSSNPVYSSGKIDYETRSYTLKLTQPLFQFHTYKEVVQARSISLRSDVDYETAKQDLILRVTQAYLTALASKESLEFVMAEEKDVQKFSDRAASRHKAGLAAVTDVYDARARLASVKAQVIKAENEYKDALQALHEITGQGITQLNNLKEEIPLSKPDPEDPNQWVYAGLTQSPKIKSQEYDTEVAKTEVERQRSFHYPRLDLIARANRQDTGGSLFGGGAVVDTQDVLIALTLPIMEGGLILSKTREADERYKKSLEALERQKRATIRQVHASYDGVHTAISRVEALKKSVEAQTVLLEAKEQGYRSGLYTSLAVLDAARDLYLYRRDYAQGRYDYILNNLRLRQAVGTLAESDIIFLNGWLE